ncbi:hypothetical protein Esti_003960 [Eimeria stiedai]
MLEQYSMGGGSVVAPAARAAAEQNLTSAGVAADEDPVVREELVLLDFPEFSFAPFLKKQKHVTLPATAGAAVGAAAELAAEAVEAGTASLTAPDIAPLVSKEDPTTAVSADEAMSGSGDATSASVAAQAAFLRRADLELRAWNLGTSAPSLLLGNFSFKGERQSQRISSTALFRIRLQKHPVMPLRQPIMHRSRRVCRGGGTTAARLTLRISINSSFPNDADFCMMRLQLSSRWAVLH